MVRHAGDRHVLGSAFASHSKGWVPNATQFWDVSSEFFTPTPFDVSNDQIRPRPYQRGRALALPIFGTLVLMHLRFDLERPYVCIVFVFIVFSIEYSQTKLAQAIQQAYNMDSPPTLTIENIARSTAAAVETTTQVWF